MHTPAIHWGVSHDVDESLLLFSPRHHLLYHHHILRTHLLRPPIIIGATTHGGCAHTISRRGQLIHSVLPSLYGLLAHVFISRANMALEHTRIVGAWVHAGCFDKVSHPSPAPLLPFLGGSRMFTVCILRMENWQAKRQKEEHISSTRVRGRWRRGEGAILGRVGVVEQRIVCEIAVDD